MRNNQSNNNNNNKPSLFLNNPSSSLSSLSSTSIFMPINSSFLSQNTHNPPPTLSSTQQKRKQFENKIRQQSRNRLKQQLRKRQQLQLLKSMGIEMPAYQQQQQYNNHYGNHNYNYQQQLYQHQNNYQRYQEQLFQRIQQQADNIVVEYFTNSYSNFDEKQSYYDNHHHQESNNSNELNNQSQLQQDDYNNSCNIHITSVYLKRAYEQIQQYRQRDFYEDPTQLWKAIQKDINQYMINVNISNKPLSITDIQWINNTLRAINHILVMEMFYSQLQWIKFRCIQPEQYTMISQWVWRIYSQHKQLMNLSQQMKQSISTLILLLICYQLKIQGSTIKQNRVTTTISTNISLNISVNTQNQLQLQQTQNNNIKGRLLWQNRILIEQLLEIQWLWSHWSLIKHSNAMDLNIYCVQRMLRIVNKQNGKIVMMMGKKKKQYYIDKNNNNKELDQNLKNIQTLLEHVNQLITMIVIKINNYSKLNLFNMGSNGNNNNKNNSKNNNNNKLFKQNNYEEFISEQLKKIVINVYETVGKLNGLLYNVDVQNQPIPSILIKQLQLLYTTDRLFGIIINDNNLQQQKQQQKQNQFQHQQQQQFTQSIQRQLKRHYRTLMKLTQLDEKHFVYQYLCGVQGKMRENERIDNSYFDNYYNKKEIQDGECFHREFVNIKVATMSEILTLSLRNININNQQQNSHNNKINNPNYFNPIKLKCLSLSLTTLTHIFQQHYIVQNILQSTQQITSIQHLTQLMKRINFKQSNNNINVTVYLVLMCKQLIAVMGQMVGILNSSKNKSRQKQLTTTTKNYNESLAVNILMLTIKALNTIAEVEQQNIWKYGCLLHEAVARAKYNVQQSKQQKYHTFTPLIQQTHLFLQYINNNFTTKNKNSNNGSRKNMRVVDIKSQLGLFVQNIVYNYFPLQTHFDQFSIKNSNQIGVREVERLIEGYNGLMNNNERGKQTIKEDKKYKNYNQQHHSQSILKQFLQMFSQHQLDTQTTHLLQIVQSLLQQTCVQTQLMAIKIVNLLIITCDNKSAFNYFVQLIKSSTQIYKKIEYMAQQAEHDKVRQVAEQFVQQVEAGFGQDEWQGEQDDGNQQRGGNSYVINKSNDKEIEI